MFFSFVIVLSGLLFAYRIATVVIDRYHLLTRSLMTKIGTTYFIQLFVISSFQPRRYVLLWVSAFVPHLFFVAIMCGLRLSRARRFRKQFAESLSLLILKMRSGKAFRHAFAEVTSESETMMKVRLGEIRDLVVFSQQQNRLPPSEFIQEIVTEFRIADRETHAALRRLHTFRSRLRCEDDFRRKSGQVLRQIRAQSLLLTGLYLAVLIFVVTRFGFQKNSTCIAMSLFFFGCGLAWIWTGGRRIRWKV